jgi:O-antigen ligase
LPQPHKYIDAIIEKGILFLLIFTPLAFGTVQPWSTAVLEITAFTLFFLYLIKKILQNPPSVLCPYPSSVIRHPSSAFNRHLPSVLCLLFVLLCLLQMLPLPEPLLKTLSPSSLTTYQTFINSPTGTLHPISLYPDATRQELFRLLAYAAIFFVIVSHYRTKDQVKSLIKTILFMGCFLVVFAIIQKMTWNGRIFWIYPVEEYLRNGHRIWGPYISYDNFAGYMEMAIPLALGLLLYRAPRISALPDAPLSLKIARFMANENITQYSLLFLIVVMLAAALIATFSRGGILAFVFSSLFFAWITRRRRSLKQKTGLLTLLAAVIFIVAVLASWDRLEDRFADIERDHVFRLTVWTDSIGIVRDYPLLGTGLGTFKNAYMRYQTDRPLSLVDHAHNDYVELLTDTGIVGFLLATGIALVFFLKTFRRWRQKRSMFGKCIGAGGLTSLVAMALHSFVDFNLHIPANALLFAVISAITYAAIFNVSDKNGIASDPIQVA